MALGFTWPFARTKPEIGIRRTRSNSLAVRLFLSATAWTVIILVITGVVLSSF